MKKYLRLLMLYGVLPLLVGPFVGIMFTVVCFSIIDGLHFLFEALVKMPQGWRLILGMIGGYAWFLRRVIRENSPEAQEKRAKELSERRRYQDEARTSRIAELTKKI